MNVEQLEQSVLNLTPEDRRRFLDWLYAHEAELVGADEAAIDAAWRQETRRRVAELESGVVTGIPGEEVSARIRKIVGR
jgi:putative addiction module component (TIGR02574 family)